MSNFYSIKHLYGLETETEKNLLFDSGTVRIFCLEELSFALEVSSTSWMQMCQGIPQYASEEKSSRVFSAGAENKSYGHLHYVVARRHLHI